VRHQQALAELADEFTGVAGAQERNVAKNLLLTHCLLVAGGAEEILLTVACERVLGLLRESHSRPHLDREH
jgi:3-oxochol-4-en-24-oyl-CoA dehydrogenase